MRLRSSGNNLLFLLFLLFILCAAVPLGYDVTPLVVNLASLDTVDGISKLEDVRGVWDLVDLSVVLDLSDRDDDDASTASEHTK